MNIKERLYLSDREMQIGVLTQLVDLKDITIMLLQSAIEEKKKVLQQMADLFCTLRGIEPFVIEDETITILGE